MTAISLLETLRDVTERATENLILPVAFQKTDDTPSERAPMVYLTRVPDTASETKKAPYILHQIVTTANVQPEGRRMESRATVRSVFCAYDENAEMGGLALLNMMERLRIALLRQPVIGRRFCLDRQEGLDTLIYPDDTAPYFIGEMVSVWWMPEVNEEVTPWHERR